EEQLVEGEEVALLSLIPPLPRDRLLRQGSGRRSKTKSGANKGRYAAFTGHPTPRQHDLALDATLRVAAPYQSLRDHTDCAVALTDRDLRFKVREDHVGATIVFAVDASGSMGAQKRMKAAKEAILSMLLDSYQKRDRIGLVAFRKEGAQTLLDITASVDLAQKKLQQLPTGGRTPLAAGLYRSWQLLKARRLKDPELLPMLVLVTDGRANRSLWTEDPVADALRAAELIRQDHIHTVVVDTEKDFISLHIARQLADAMDAVYYKVDELKAEQLQTIVKNRSILAGLDG
ncbi:MAG: VWA domain-containing protein, partial [Oscillospiraceae bacterium]